MAPSRVREDDGTLVPFRERKVAEGIAAALTAAGEPDRALADELAGVVTLFIDRSFPGVPPSVADVLDLSERVLDETGHAKAARAFRRLRQQREELRRMIAVRRVKAPAPDALDHAPDGEDPALCAWSRSKLVAALIDEEGVPAPMAQDIASAVERRLVEGGFSVVTTTLIRELAAHEMFQRGLARAENDAAAEVPWRDVARALYADEEAARAPDAVVASSILARFALKDLHGPAVVRAHRTGRLHLGGLEQPVAVERAEVPMALLVGDGAPLDARRLLLRVRATLGSLRPHVRDVVRLPDLVGWLAEHADADAEALVDDLLLAVVPRDAFGRPVRPIAELVVPLAGAAASPLGASGWAFVTALLGRAARQKPDFRVRLAVGPGPVAAADLEIGLAAARGLLEAHPETPFAFVREDDASPRPITTKYPVPLRLSVGRVALNLPMCFMDVAGKSLAEAVPDLEEGVRRATEALFERLWIQRRGPAFGVHGLVQLFGGPSRVQVTADGQEADIDLWGLPTALGLLVARGLIPEAGRAEAAAKILSIVAFLTGEERDHLRLRPVIGGVRDRAVRRRLLDATTAAASRWGVDDLRKLLAGEVLPDGTLPVAAPLFADRNRPLLSGAAAERLGPGLALPAASMGGPLDAALVADLYAKTRLRLAVFSADTDPAFEIQEELF